MGRRRAECSRLRDGNESADVIEIDRFAHAQHSCAAPIIALKSSIWNKGIRHSGIHGNLETLAPRSRVDIGKRPYRQQFVDFRLLFARGVR